MTESYAVEYRDALELDLEHYAAHLTDEETDYCERDFVLSDMFGFLYQVDAVLALLDAESPGSAEAIRDLCEVPEGRVFDEFDGERDETYENSDLAHAVANEIEEQSDYYWGDGNVYRRKECDLGDFDPLDISIYENVANSDDRIIYVTITAGGPHAQLIRDADADRLEVYSGGDRAVSYDLAVTTLLDYVLETYGY